MRKLTFALLLAAACSSTAPAAAPEDAGLTDTTAPPRSEACATQDAEMQAALNGARTSPNAMLAIKNTACGTTVYASGDTQKADARSLWRIGSVTKTFVSAAILSLVKDGKVSLDDPLEKWVPAVPKTAAVTVRHLLNHRSGIFNYTEDPSFFADRKRVWKPQEIVALATTHDPYFAPDAGFHYSNTNYVLLGMILEIATGSKAGAALRARASGLAGLKRTFLDGEDTLDGPLARGFAGDTDVTTIGDPSSPWTAGAMVASGGDLADWVFALYGTDAVLDASQRATLVANASTMDAEVEYGLGVVILPASRSRAGMALGHDGGIDGFVTMAYYFPDKKTSVAVVVNDRAADPSAIFRAALSKLFP